MSTKLTLSIKEETIERAKRISKKRGKSISRMVEEYFEALPEKDVSEDNPVDKIKKILKGKIDKNVDWKKAKEDHLTTKYGL